MKRFLSHYIMASLFVLFSIPFLLVASNERSTLWEILHEWRRFEGVVVEIGERSDQTHRSNGSGFTLLIEPRYFRIVEFTMDGKSVLGHEEIRSTFKPTIGENIPVFVSLEEPAEVRIGSFKELWVAPLLWTILSVPFFLVGLSLLLYCIHKSIQYLTLRLQGIRLEVTSYEFATNSGESKNGQRPRLIVAKFRVGDVEYKAESESFFGELIEPQRIELAYNPKNPKIAMIMPLKTRK